MKRATYALLLGILFVFAGMTTAQADYGYSGYRSSYHGHSNHGHSYHAPVKVIHVYKYRPSYRPPVVHAPHCDHPAPVYRYSRGHY